MTTRFEPGSNTSNVVAMNRFQSGKSLSPLRQAEAYWTALRNGHDVPTRSSIDPRGLENVLEFAFIIERIAPGVARFRLAGQHLHQLAGMEVRGMPLTAFFCGTARTEMSAVLETLFDAPCIAELELSAEAGLLKRPSEARMVLLPLRSDTGSVDRALGVLVADGPTRATPVRFAISQSNIRSIPGHNKQEHPKTDGSDQEFAEDQAPFQTKTGHLKLVVSRSR